MNEDRFIILKAKNDRVLYATDIIVDLATGVQYLFAATGNSGGLTPLLDPEGKPLLYRDPDPGYF